MSLGQKIRNEAFRDNTRKVIWAALILGIFGMHFYDHEDEKKGVPIFVVQGTTHYMGPATPVMQQREYHKEIAKLALAAIFMRLPEGEIPAANQPPNTATPWLKAGFPMGETIVRITNTKTQNALMEAALRDKETFENQRMTRVFVPSREIDEKAISDDQVAMGVDGDIISISKNGNFTKPESKPWRVDMILQRNDDWANNAKYPMVVVAMTDEPLKVK